MKQLASTQRVLEVYQPDRYQANVRTNLARGLVPQVHGSDHYVARSLDNPNAAGLIAPATRIADYKRVATVVQPKQRPSNTEPDLALGRSGRGERQHAQPRWEGAAVGERDTVSGSPGHRRRNREPPTRVAGGEQHEAETKQTPGEPTTYDHDDKDFSLTRMVPAAVAVLRIGQRAA